MKKLLTTMTIPLGLIGLLGLTGVAGAQPYPPPPALYHEAIPRPHAPRHVWQPGHWQWNGFNYVWVRGRYIPVRPQYRQWVHGHWEQGRHGWRWVEGHWR